jgi:hypothetical protein
MADTKNKHNSQATMEKPQIKRQRRKAAFFVVEPGKCVQGNTFLEVMGAIQQDSVIIRGFEMSVEPRFVVKVR